MTCQMSRELLGGRLSCLRCRSPGCPLNWLGYSFQRSASGPVFCRFVFRLARHWLIIMSEGGAILH
jgi:hypothetical protein